MPEPRIAVPAVIGALAAASLLAPFTPFYDPWAWLVWGRETIGLDLDTVAGPSWKPLPVLIAALVAPTGDAAPALWLAIARAGWLASVALAFRLAWRLAHPLRVGAWSAVAPEARRVRAGRALAGAVAAAGVILLFDPFTSWIRQFAGGLSEPLLVALVLGAIDRGLSRRPAQALGLGFAAALLRPEVWPLLALYGAYHWRREPRLRVWLVAAALALPALWLLPDLLGSGDLFTGAERAREASGAPVHEAIESLGRSFELPLLGLWAAGAIGVAAAVRDREREVVVLGAGTLAWIAIVAVLAAAGYAGLPRFAAPAAALACVLGGVGVARLLDAAGHARPRRAAALALAGVVIAALGVQGFVRASELPGELDRAADYGDRIDRLDALVERVGAGRIVGCSPVTSTDFLSETALAWRLELPISEIHSRFRTAPPAGTAIVDDDDPDPATRAIEDGATPIGQLGEWSAYEVSCGTATSAASGRAIAGVSGASRYGGSASSPSSR